MEVIAIEIHVCINIQVGYSKCLLLAHSSRDCLATRLFLSITHLSTLLL